MDFLKKAKFEGKYIFSGYVVDIDATNKKIDIITYFDNDKNVFDAKLLSFECNNDFDFNKIKEGYLVIVKASLQNKLNPHLLKLHEFNRLKLDYI